MNLDEFQRNSEWIEEGGFDDETKNKLIGVLTNQVIDGKEAMVSIKDDDGNIEQVLDPRLQAVQDFYTELGFVPGAYIKDIDFPNTKGLNVGRIESFNNNMGGFYDGIRFPLDVSFGHIRDKYGIFSMCYEEIIGYKEKFGSAKAFLEHLEERNKTREKYGKDIMLYEILEPEVGEKVLAVQETICSMSLEDLYEFVENERGIEMGLPYVHEFAEKKLDWETRPR